MKLHTIAAILQTSVLAPHFAPRMTSGERYWRVWMSLVKWCPTQHALPRSAIFTEIFSNAVASFCFFFSADEVGPLSNEMLEMSLVKTSLFSKSATTLAITGFVGNLRSLFPLFLLLFFVFMNLRVRGWFFRFRASYSTTHYDGV